MRLEVGEHPVRERARVAAPGPADADPQAEELLRLQVLRDRAEAVVAGQAAEALVSRAADAVEALDAEGVERAQAQVNRR